MFPILVSELVKESILDKVQGTHKHATEHTTEDIITLFTIYSNF